MKKIYDNPSFEVVKVTILDCLRESNPDPEGGVPDETLDGDGLLGGFF